MPSDTRIAIGDQNNPPFFHVTGENIPDRAGIVSRKPIHVMLVNISGDVYNPGGGGGAGSDVNLSQVAGIPTAVNAGNADNGTQRVIIASDQPAIPVTGTFSVTTTPTPVTGVQVVGGVNSQVSPSGDFPVRISAVTAGIGVTGDVSTKPLAGQTWPVREQSVLGVYVVGGDGHGTVGITGDVRIKQAGGLAVSITGDNNTPIAVRIALQTGGIGITGDASTKPAGGSIWPVREQGVIGAQVVGGGIGATVAPSGGTTWNVREQAVIGVQVLGGGNARVSISGDVLNVREQNVIGVQVAGGRAGITGDVSIIPSPTINATRVPVSGDAIISDGANPSIKATVKSYSRSNPLTVVLVNSSGDAYNAGGGGVSSGGAVLDGVDPNIKATVLSGPTTRPGATSNPQLVQIGDDPTRQLGIIYPGVIGVQVVGGLVNRVSISGDQLLVIQGGAWATSVTGDVSTIPKAGQVWPVREQGVIGVQVLGGAIGGQVGISGDVTTVPKPGQTWPVSQQGVIGVQVLGGQVGGSHGVTGDVSIKPGTTPAGVYHPVSGDFSIADGANKTIKATVKNYTRSNPVAVVMVNISGDPYNPMDQPVILVAAGRVNNQGSNTLIAAVPGKRIKVFSYSLQGDGDNARGYFASGASGSQLTTEWELASREGVAKQIGSENAQCLFATTAGALLSFESSSSKPMKYDISYQVDDAS